MPGKHWPLLSGFLQIMSNDVLEFEDLLEIVTPSGIDRRIIALDSAWQQLGRLNNTSFIAAEIKAWEAWAKSVLDSWSTKVFATGILSELDIWKKRYASAYAQAKNKDAPTPDVFKEESSILASPYLWIAISLVVGTGLYFYAKPSINRIIKQVKTKTTDNR